MTPPDRSLAQRMDALAYANEIRSARALLRRDLKAGRASIVAVLKDPPSCIESMKVFDLLIAVPKVGRVKVTKLLSGCRISPSKTIGGLTQRQLDELGWHLRRGVTQAERVAYTQQLGRPARQRIAA